MSILKHVGANTLADIEKGAPVGHEFYGNQYTSGAGGSGKEGWKSNPEDPESIPVPPKGAKVKTAYGDVGVVSSSAGNQVSVETKSSLGFPRTINVHASKLSPMK